MTCESARWLFEDALRDRLAVADREELGRHLAGCSPCAEAYGRIERQARVVATFGTAVDAPVSLRRWALAVLVRRGRGPRWKSALAGAVAGALLVAGAFSILNRLAEDPLEMLTREVVNDHVRVVLRQRAVEAAPEDPKTLQTIMARVLDFPVPSPFPGNGVNRLIGGRPSYLLQREVACFYYRTPSSLATLFIVPVDRLGGLSRWFPSAPEVRKRGDYQMAFWRSDGLAYFLVSDSSSHELSALTEGIRRM